VISIGVTGHRFLVEVKKLQEGIDQALIRIDQKYPGQAWSVISSLAEGADRLVVERVVSYRPSAGLVVPLPLPFDEYQKDFSSDESKHAFLQWFNRAREVIPPPDVIAREDGYWVAGKYVLEHCAVLVALWDGQPEQGKGGTGAIVAIARKKHLPLAWVQCGNRQPATQQPLSLGNRQGKVLFERF
jgi:hypothetical protein